MKKQVERDANATPSPRGYTIDLYCCEPGCRATANACADGYYAYSYAHKQARQMGWVLHNDGYATCPDCAKKKKEVEG